LGAGSPSEVVAVVVGGQVAGVLDGADQCLVVMTM